MKEHTYELDEPISYGDGSGNITEGTSITFTAPRAKNRKTAAKLKQMFFRSMPTNVETSSESKPTDDDAEIGGAEILFLIAQSTNVDYSDFIDLGRTLVCDGNAKIDGVAKFTTALADKMEVDELENLIGEYVAVFIVRSALRSALKSL